MTKPLRIKACKVNIFIANNVDQILANALLLQSNDVETNHL